MLEFVIGYLLGSAGRAGGAERTPAQPVTLRAMLTACAALGWFGGAFMLVLWLVMPAALDCQAAHDFAVGGLAVAACSLLAGGLWLGVGMLASAAVLALLARFA